MKISKIKEKFNTYNVYVKYGISDIIYNTYKNNFTDDDEITLDHIQNVVDKYKNQFYYEQIGLENNDIIFQFTSRPSKNVAGHIIANFKSQSSLFSKFVNKDIKTITDFDLQQSIAPYVTGNYNIATRTYYTVDEIEYFSNLITTITPNKFGGFFKAYLPEFDTLDDYMLYMIIIKRINDGQFLYKNIDTNKKDTSDKIQRPIRFNCNFDKYIKWYIKDYDTPSIDILNIQISIAKYINEIEFKDKTFIQKLKCCTWYKYSQSDMNIFKLDSDIFDLILNSEYLNFVKFIHNFNAKIDSKEIYHTAMNFLQDMTFDNMNMILNIFNIKFENDNTIIHNYINKTMDRQLIEKTQKLGKSVKTACYYIAKDKYADKNLVYDKQDSLINNIKQKIQYSNDIFELYSEISEFSSAQGKYMINIGIEEIISCDNFNFNQFKQLLIIELCTKRESDVKNKYPNDSDQINKIDDDIEIEENI